jgi:prepilin-type processing-associated H-X9-DG protein
MRTLSTKAKIKGLTLLEVLLVLVVVFILAAMFLPSTGGSHRAKLPMCLNNLKQIDLCLTLFAEDNQGRFPMQIPVTNGGTMEFIYSDHAFPHFQKLKTYNNSRDILICPFETNRQAAASFEALNDLNISYFLNADASANDPSRTIVAGDRFLQVNGQPVKPGLFALTTNSNARWTPNFHLSGGSLAFADGHVEFNRNNNLNSFIQNQPLATNRLTIP